jgi:HK97 family phage portal protein
VALISNGAVKTPTFLGATSDWFYNYERPFFWNGYAIMYRAQPWVYTVVSKRARSLARLPLKTYIHDELNRPETPQTNPYRLLLEKPNPKISPFRFWEWTSSTYDVYGEAFWYKRRDRGGRPIILAPLHPTGMQYDPLRDEWNFANGKAQLQGIKSSDLVHFKSYNPADDNRGMSALEPLRVTLEHEASSKAATSAFWRNGARPGFVLKHPANLSEPAQARLKLQFDSYSGVDSTGRSLVLEEGMEPQALTISAEDAQYIDSRKLNREEVCAVYDMPPPAVQILDNATYSNITEQMRSLYRDTMAAIIKAFESDLDTQLRMPDFADDVYAEFLLDGVLRGDFEARTTAFAKADYMTVAEKRRAENLPFIEGTDVILVNTATLPLDRVNDPGPIDAGVPGPTNQPNTPADDTEDPPEEQKRIIRVPAKRLDVGIRTVMGRLSRVVDVDDIDEPALVDGLDPVLSRAVLAQVHRSKSWSESVAELRARLKTIQKEIAA